MMPKLGMKCRSIPLAANENIKNLTLDGIECAWAPATRHDRFILEFRTGTRSKRSGKSSNHQVSL